MSWADAVDYVVARDHIEQEANKVFADLATSWLYVASNFLVLTHYLLSLYLSLRFTHMHTHTHTHTHTYTLAGFGHKRGSVQKMKLFNVKRLLSFSAGYT